MACSQSLCFYEIHAWGLCTAIQILQATWGELGNASLGQNPRIRHRKLDDEATRVLLPSKVPATVPISVRHLQPCDLVARHLSHEVKMLG